MGWSSSVIVVSGIHIICVLNCALLHSALVIVLQTIDNVWYCLALPWYIPSHTFTRFVQVYIKLNICFFSRLLLAYAKKLQYVLLGSTRHNSIVATLSPGLVILKLEYRLIPPPKKIIISLFESLFWLFRTRPLVNKVLLLLMSSDSCLKSKKFADGGVSWHHDAVMNKNMMSYSYHGGRNFYFYLHDPTNPEWASEFIRVSLVFWAE